MSHREIPELYLACITSSNSAYDGRCSERPPINSRYHTICVKESAILQRSASRTRRLASYTRRWFSVKKFKKYVILFISARKIPLTILVTVGHSFGFACELELAHPVANES